MVTERIATRGVTHRFHLDPSAPGREVDLYADAASQLMTQGVKVLHLDTDNATPPDVARRIADAIPALPIASVTSPTHPTPQGT